LRYEIAHQPCQPRILLEVFGDVLLRTDEDMVLLLYEKMIFVAKVEYHQRYKGQYDESGLRKYIFVFYLCHFFIKPSTLQIYAILSIRPNFLGDFSMLFFINIPVCFVRFL
jgi:hypothetical protein